MHDRTTSSTASEKATASWQALACLVLYWLALCLATHWRNPWPPGGTPSYPDKLVHFTAYGVLAGLAVYALGKWLASRGRTLSAWHAAAILATIVAYGLLDEFTQPLTGRDFEWLDWAADTGGAACGTLLAFYWRLRRKNRKYS